MSEEKPRGLNWNTVIMPLFSLAVIFTLGVMGYNSFQEIDAKANGETLAASATELNPIAIGGIALALAATLSMVILGAASRKRRASAEEDS